MTANTSQIDFIPRGLSRVEAARYVGVSPGTFDKLIGEGVMPSPKRFRKRLVWDRQALDLAFDTLDNGQDAEPNDFDHLFQ